MKLSPELTHCLWLVTHLRLTSKIHLSTYYIFHSGLCTLGKQHFLKCQYPIILSNVSHRHHFLSTMYTTQQLSFQQWNVAMQCILGDPSVVSITWVPKSGYIMGAIADIQTAGRVYRQVTLMSAKTWSKQKKDISFRCVGLAACLKQCRKLWVIGINCQTLVKSVPSNFPLPSGHTNQLFVSFILSAFVSAHSSR